jgi:dihydropteroate synthase
VDPVGGAGAGAPAAAAAADGRERIAFVTGTLAEPALRQTLAELAPRAGFAYEVVTLNIAVAALMTAEWAARRLRLPAGVARAIFPGHLSGDLAALAAAAGVPVERGPKDLRELPGYFARGTERSADYGAHEIEIVAEVNNVPRLSRAEVVAAARRYRQAGADVIDLGCDPGGAFAGIGDCVRALRDEGFRVSVDSLEPAEILPAEEAGAELVFSACGANVDRLLDLDCEFVVIPDDPRSLAGLDATAARLEARGRRCRLDPVLEPIGFGFAASLGRYLEVRRRWPRAEMLLGIGNLTELTGVDSAAANVVLLGFCAELGIRSVLTTEVAPWTRSSVRELDLARRLVHHAITRKQVPKHLEPGLHLLRDEKVLAHGRERLGALAREIRDRNFRLFAEEGTIHAINSERHLQGTDPFALFEAMEVADASHAFYLGYELAKAVTALALGKNYVQDEALKWGFLTVDEKSHGERGKKGTEAE